LQYFLPSCLQTEKKTFDFCRQFWDKKYLDSCNELVDLLVCWLAGPGSGVG
jgi:hypothetical protein